MKFIFVKQLVVVRFYLSGVQWDQFYQFYEQEFKGIFIRFFFDLKRYFISKRGGYVVVFTSYDVDSLRLMNLWGDDWVDNGFFRVQDVNVLLGLKFFDVFWIEDSLSEEEKIVFDQYGVKIVVELMRLL